MDDSRERTTANGRSRRLRLPALALMLGALAVETPSASFGAPIRSRNVATPPRTNRLAAFLDGGPEVWSRVAPPRFPAGMRLRASADGVLEETPFVNYLRWRRSLDPARFDRNHPRVGPMLERDRIVRAGRLTPPVVTPRVPEVPLAPPERPITPRVTPRSPQIGVPPVVPEPSTWLIGLALAGAGAAWRRSKARRADAA